MWRGPGAFLLTLVLGADAGAANFLERCNNQTIRGGEASASVLAKCGQPVFNKRGVDLDGRVVDRRYYLPDRKWRRPARILVFQDGVLVRIRNLTIDWVQCGPRRDDVVRRGDSKTLVLTRCGAPELSTLLGIARGRRIEEWRFRVARRGRWSTYTATFLDETLGFIEVYRDSRR